VDALYDGAQVFLINKYLKNSMIDFLYFYVFKFNLSYSYAPIFAVNHWTDMAFFSDNSNIGNKNWGIL
jgi:hypothetical protein